MRKLIHAGKGQIITLLFLSCLAGAFPAEAEKTALSGPDPKEREAAAEHIEEILRSTEELESRWDKTKEKYKEEMDKQVNALEAALEERQSSLDYGDKDLRDQIKEHIEDLSRAKADLEGELTELTAATGVDLSQAKGDLERTINDWKD